MMPTDANLSDSYASDQRCFSGRRSSFVHNLCSCTEASCEQIAKKYEEINSKLWRSYKQVTKNTKKLPRSYKEITKNTKKLTGSYEEITNKLQKKKKNYQEVIKKLQINYELITKNTKKFQRNYKSFSALSQGTTSRPLLLRFDPTFIKDTQCAE